MKKLILTIAAVLSMASMAHALQFTFNVWNHDNTIGDYGKVVITKNSLGDIVFEIKANTGFFTGDSTGLTWDKFFFNYKGATPLDMNNFKFGTTPGKWAVTQPGGNASTFGVFDDKADPTKGIGNNSINPLSFYYDTPDNVTLDESDFVDKSTKGYLFEGHLRRISSPSDLGGSVQLAVLPPAVPEPGTIVLLGTGLLGLAAYGRKKMKK